MWTHIPHLLDVGLFCNRPNRRNLAASRFYDIISQMRRVVRLCWLERSSSLQPGGGRQMRVTTSCTEQVGGALAPAERRRFVSTLTYLAL